MAYTCTSEDSTSVSSSVSVSAVSLPAVCQISPFILGLPTKKETSRVFLARNNLALSSLSLFLSPFHFLLPSSTTIHSITINRFFILFLYFRVHDAASSWFKGFRSFWFSFSSSPSSRRITYLECVLLLIRNPCLFPFCSLSFSPGRFPFYYEIKTILVIWLLSPATKGSSILYRRFVHPALIQREAEIDEALARATEQGYTAVLHLGSKGVNYATTVLMQTAIKVSFQSFDQLS